MRLKAADFLPGQRVRYVDQYTHDHWGIGRVVSKAEALASGYHYNPSTFVYTIFREDTEKRTTMLAIPPHHVQRAVTMAIRGNELHLEEA